MHSLCACITGYNPKEFKGTNTGVFAATFASDTEANLVTNKIPRNGYTLPGISRAMLANRISYWLDVNGTKCSARVISVRPPDLMTINITNIGPSYAVDTACSSSAYALEHAYKAMRTGSCDAAIIAAVNICLSPGATFMFNELGVLSPDGRCNSFDQSGIIDVIKWSINCLVLFLTIIICLAGGYTRSESIVVIVLQKKKDARRIYARVVHCKTNSDGYKEAGAFVPSSKAQTQLMKDFYGECGVNPSKVNFVEAHATGTQV